MALVQKVQDIIAKAEAISQMGFMSRPAEYEKLVSADIVPVLLAVAEHIDGFNEPLPDGVEQVSVADVLNQFKDELVAFQGHGLQLVKDVQDLKQEITTLKGRMTKLQKSSTGAAA